MSDLQDRRHFACHCKHHADMHVDTLVQSMTVAECEEAIRRLEENLRSPLRASMDVETRARTSIDATAAIETYQKVIKRLTT
jgi:hypothetical protein